MKTIVVYESLWGNTEAIARAIAEGIGPDTQVLSTDAATPDVVAGADLIVAGSPLLGFTLPTEQMLNDIRKNPANKSPVDGATVKPMRLWLDDLPKGTGRAASFETRIWWSPGSAAKAILRKLNETGYATVAPAEKFVVSGKYGPLKDGELNRAREWGASLRF